MQVQTSRRLMQELDAVSIPNDLEMAAATSTPGVLRGSPAPVSVPARVMTDFGSFRAHFTALGYTEYMEPEKQDAQAGQKFRFKLPDEPAKSVRSIMSAVAPQHEQQHEAELKAEEAFPTVAGLNLPDSIDVVVEELNKLGVSVESELEFLEEDDFKTLSLKPVSRGKIKRLAETIRRMYQIQRACPDIETGFDDASRVNVTGRQFGIMSFVDPIGMQGRMLSSANSSLGTSQARPDETTDPDQPVDENASTYDKAEAAGMLFYEVVFERLMVAIHPWMSHWRRCLAWS